MRVTSLAEFNQTIAGIVRKWTPQGADWYLQPWFRGHGNSEWSLDPGWLRLPRTAPVMGSDYYSEATLMETFKLRAPIYLERSRPCARSWRSRASANPWSSRS